MQGDSATTVSISFTTRYFNFEKILLQDFWELLKPFNVEHFGESAEFYVCFSDTKSLVAAYQALNKRPIGKYFTLNMELTDAQRALLPRNPNDASKTSEGRDVVTDGDYEILEEVEFEEDKYDSDSAEYEYIEVDADAVLNDDEEVQYLVLAEDGNFHEVDIATYRASQKIAASEREDDSESSEAKTEKTSKVFVVVESGSSEEIKDEKKENKKEAKTKRVRNSSSSQDTDDDEVSSDSKSDLSTEPDKYELANAKPVRVESKHAATYSSDTSRSNDSRKLAGKENKPSANVMSEYRRERTPERRGNSRRDEKRGDTKDSRRYEASPKRYDRYEHDRPKERDRGRRHSPERSGRGHFDDRRRERSFSSDSFEDDRRKKYGKSKNERYRVEESESYSRSRTKESTRRGKGNRSFSESPSRHNNGKRSNTRRKDERSDSRERDRVKDRDRERDRGPKKSGRDRSRSRSKSPKPKRRDEVRDDRHGKKDERKEDKRDNRRKDERKVDDKKLPADSHQERKQPVPTKESPSTRGQDAKSETASTTSKAKPLSPRKQPPSPTVPKPATPNPPSTLTVTQLFASAQVPQEKQPPSTTGEARPPSQAASQPQPQPQAVKPAVTKPEDNSATPEWVNVDAHLPGPTMTDGADSSDGKEIPVEMMPEGKNWRKMLEEFCAQRGKTPPKFVKIQNKTNNMWSCKVITYKSDYVAGGEFSYRRQAVQVSSQVAYNKLLTHEQLMSPSPLGRGKPNNGRGGKGASPNGRPNPTKNNWGNTNNKPRW